MSYYRVDLTLTVHIIIVGSSVHGETLPTSKPTAEQTVTYTDTRTQGGLSKMDVQLLSMKQS